MMSILPKLLHRFSVFSKSHQMFYIEIEKHGDEIDVKISADGFLYNMVRIIVGTLTEVAYGRITPDDIIDIINSKDRKNAGITAPPEGLYLNKVSY